MYISKWVSDGRRIEIHHDPNNWTIMHGPSKLKSFEKHAEYWYFSTLEGMIMRLFVLLRDQELGSLDLKGISKANKVALSQITKIAKKLEILFADAPHKEIPNEKEKK